MIRKEIKENVFGGSGKIQFEYILNDEQLNGMCRLYAKVTIPSGNSLGYHEHKNESETYYILSGKGVYTDTYKKETEVNRGDVTFTGHGEGHGIKNIGTEDLVFMALIIYDEKRKNG